MLASHEESSKHVGNLAVSNSASVLIRLPAKSGHHVAFILRASKGHLVASKVKKHTILPSALRFWMMLT